MERTRARDAQIGEIKRAFDKMTSAVFLDFKGMTVEHVTKLRDEFRKAASSTRSSRTRSSSTRSRTRRAAASSTTCSSGMTGIAWSYEDPERRRQGRQGVPQGRRRARSSRSRPASSRARCSTAKRVEDQLATMPGKDELRAKLLATLQAPLQQFVALLQAPAQNFVYAARRRKSAKG